MKIYHSKDRNWNMLLANANADRLTKSVRGAVQACTATTTAKKGITTTTRATTTAEGDDKIDNLLNCKQIHFTQFMYKFISRLQFPNVDSRSVLGGFSAPSEGGGGAVPLAAFHRNVNKRGLSPSRSCSRSRKVSVTSRTASPVLTKWKLPRCVCDTDCLCVCVCERPRRSQVGNEPKESNGQWQSPVGEENWQRATGNWRQQQTVHS